MLVALFYRLKGECRSLYNLIVLLVVKDMTILCVYIHFLHHSSTRIPLNSVTLETNDLKHLSMVIIRCANFLTLSNIKQGALTELLPRPEQVYYVVYTFSIFVDILGTLV